MVLHGDARHLFLGLPVAREERSRFPPALNGDIEANRTHVELVIRRVEDGLWRATWRHLVDGDGDDDVCLPARDPVIRQDWRGDRRAAARADTERGLALPPEYAEE